MAYTGPTTQLQPGSKDTASVKQLQDYLVSQGLMTQTQVNTGYGTYGPQTTAAVLALQKKLGIDYSSGPGYFGPRTLAALQAPSPASVVPPTPPAPVVVPAPAPIPTPFTPSTPVAPITTPIKSVSVVSYKDNPDGTTTNYLSDGTTSIVKYTKNPDGSLTPVEVGGTFTQAGSAVPNASVPTAQSYVVQSGDTLSAIAARLGVKVSDISGYRSGNPNLIFPGENLTINKGGVAPKLSTDVFPTPPGPVQPLKWGAGSTPAPTPTPAPSPTPTPAGGTPTGGDPYQAQKDAAIKAANDQAKSFLDSITTKDVETRKSSEILTKILTSIESTAAPQAPQSMAQLFNEQKSKLGLDVLETKLADMDSEIDRVNANLLVESEKAGQELVSMREITRTRGSLQMEAQQRIALLNVERNAVARQVGNKLDTLKMVMDYTGQDFTNSTNYYNQNFNRNVQLYNLVKGIEDSSKTEVQRAKDDAQANINTLTTMFKAAGVDYMSLSADQRLTIAKLEIQAGLPSGFVATALSNAEKPIRSIITSDDNTQATLIYDDGSTKTISTGLAAKVNKTADMTAAEKKESLISQVSQAFEQYKGRDNFVSPEDWKQLRAIWLGQGGILKDFIDNFRVYTNPADPLDYNLSESGSSAV